MAKLSAHGMEIGRIEYTTKTQAFFIDGKVLENAGFGWKLKYKVKEGLKPGDVFLHKLNYQKQILEQRPSLRAYRKELHSLAGISKRWKLHAAVQLMPDDADGVWSEACDGYGDNCHASIDEVVELCRLYGAMKLEAAQFQTTAQATD
jgi:hypothetical protein